MKYSAPLLGWLCVACLGCVDQNSLVGTPERIEKTSVAFRDNAAPDTFFDVAPPDDPFVDEAIFRWIGTDVDGDVVAFQYQLVLTDSLYHAAAGEAGHVIRSIVPYRERDPGDDPAVDPDFYHWSARTADNFAAFQELDDGCYEFRVRSIDDDRAADPTPARSRFRIRFDPISPTPVIINSDECGKLRVGLTRHIFLIDATDSSRGGPTARHLLEYSVQLRATSQTACSQHLADPFTEWRPFPTDGLPVQIGDAPPTLYVDLFPPGCTWRFTLRVRDPAGNVGVTTCDIMSP